MNNENIVRKKWLFKEIDFGSIQQVVNTYHMYDSTGNKVGSMVFGNEFREGLLISKDTSQFDDGSVYETAIFEFDTSRFEMRKIHIQMKTQNVDLDIQLEQDLNKRIKGNYLIIRDTVEQTFLIDTTYQFDVFRSELYMLLQTLPINSGDTIELSALVPTNMNVSNSMLIYSGEETITTNSGEHECHIVSLVTDGIMPSNKIWIGKRQPRTLYKFYVSNVKLTIELVNQEFIKSE